jgi:hypothetical protein
VTPAVGCAFVCYSSTILYPQVRLVWVENTELENHFPRLFVENLSKDDVFPCRATRASQSDDRGEAKEPDHSNAELL